MTRILPGDPPGVAHGKRAAQFTQVKTCTPDQTQTGTKTCRLEISGHDPSASSSKGLVAQIPSAAIRAFFLLTFGVMWGLIWVTSLMRLATAVL